MTTDPFIDAHKGLKVPKDYVHNRSVELDLCDDAQCKQLIQDFIAQQPAPWNEDIGE